MKVMKKQLLWVVSIFVFTVFIAVGCTPAANLSKMSSADMTELIKGGSLYDKWPKVLHVETKGTHPSYPSTGKKKGDSTWRCKECHGWDYMGIDGAYSSGSHKTGIKGIRAMAGQDLSMIAEILMNDTHAFGKMIPEDSIRALAKFVSEGQVDMDKYIDRATKMAKGDAKRGEKFYVNTCTKCHGEDGKKINFKNKEKPEYLGTVANKNPWEVLHKVRFGQPASKMLTTLFLSIQDQVDIVAYSQTLPSK